jgi:hypothetical protein
MAAKLDWDKLNKKKQRRKNGTDDAEGYMSPGHQRTSQADDIASDKPPKDATLLYVQTLASSDFHKHQPPPVPKEVMKRLGVSAAQDVALKYLRGQTIYKNALQKILSEQS